MPDEYVPFLEHGDVLRTAKVPEQTLQVPRTDHQEKMCQKTAAEVPWLQVIGDLAEPIGRLQI